MAQVNHMDAAKSHEAAAKAHHAAAELHGKSDIKAALEQSHKARSLSDTADTQSTEACQKGGHQS